MWKRLNLTPILFFILLFNLSAQAAPLEFILNHEGPDSPSKFRFSIDYTMGTHWGNTYLAYGKIYLDPKATPFLWGTFKIPIHSLRTGNKKRNCHMREALGLNYENSRYPEEHVCNKADRLPQEGPNSVSYPNISFIITGARMISGDISKPGRSVLRVTGEWDIHGVKKESSHTFLVYRSKGEVEKLRIEGQISLFLSKFGVKVKPVRIFGATLRTKDRVKLYLDFRMATAYPSP